MECITIDFLQGTVHTEDRQLNDVDPRDVFDAKASICALLSLDTAADIITIDFAHESVSSDGLCAERPGLSNMEVEIESLLWHSVLGLSNVVNLVNALVKGEVGWEVFQDMMLLEYTNWGPNATVTKCLEQIHRER